MDEQVGRRRSETSGTGPARQGAFEDPVREAASTLQIVRAEALHVRVPFRRPFLDATGEFTHRRSWLLRLVDADGLEGLGEAALPPAAAEVTTASLATLLRALVPALAGGSFPAAGALALEGEPGRAAQAAVDGAAAALVAARAAPPASSAPSAAELTDPASVAVAATIGFGGPAAGAEAAAQAVELGFGTLELRAGFERETDQLVERLRAVRAAVGPEPRLRIDAGGAWDLETAVERLLAVEPFRIEFVEQPLPAWDLTGHAALRERVRVAVALDEAIDSEGAARAALAEGAADILVVKPARVGGHAAAVRIARAAAGAGVPVVFATFFETGVGIAAALRAAGSLPAFGPERAHGLATAGVLAHDLLDAPLPIEDGRMAIPGALHLDEFELGRYTIDRIEAATT